MGRIKERFIDETGGFRFGESEAGFKARVAEIENLNSEFRRVVGSSPEDKEKREQILRRLCELMGTDFDAPD